MHFEQSLKCLTIIGLLFQFKHMVCFLALCIVAVQRIIFERIIECYKTTVFNISFVTKLCFFLSFETIKKTFQVGLIVFNGLGF